tara:strand:+ start:489 stop:1445 length:957 start_codon:yes stop_codon:yes gene_type:complete
MKRKFRVAKLKGGGADFGDPGRAQERADRGYGSTKAAVDKSTKTQTANHNRNVKNRGTTTTINTSVRKDPPPQKESKNIFKTVGYETKKLASKYLGLDKPKTKYNLNDYRVTTREIGLNNRNLTGKDRTLATAKDIKEAFELQGAYETKRGIEKMPLGATKVAATFFSKPLQKGTIRNRKFFEKSVLGTDKKGSLYTDKTFDGLGIEKRNEMYKEYAKKRQNKEIDAFGRPVRQRDGDGSAQAKCPDGTFPPCITTPSAKVVPKTFQPKKFFDFQAYNSGGVSSGPPPKKGPNPQVPPVKMSKGGGAAIRGTKFKGVF